MASTAMILRTTQTSPFGRKVRIAALRLGLADRIERAEVDLMDPNDPIHGDNPLSKMPCLVLPDGTALYDSPVILEYLDHLAQGGLFPVRFADRLDALCEQALADGLSDAALAMGSERRFRSEAHVSEAWLAHQRKKVLAALRAFERSPPALDPIGVGSVSLACALGYLDWRKPVDWRSECPGLADWLDDFRRRAPEYDQTQA